MHFHRTEEYTMLIFFGVGGGRVGKKLVGVKKSSATVYHGDCVLVACSEKHFYTNLTLIQDEDDFNINTLSLPDGSQPTHQPLVSKIMKN